MPLTFIKRIDIGAQLSKQNSKSYYYRPLVVLFFVYLLAFILSIFLSIEYAESDTLIESLVFFVFFGFACVINFYIFKKSNDLHKVSEFTSQLFSAALSADCEFYIILDDALNIAFLDPKLSLELFQLGGKLRIDELENIFDILNLKKEVKSSIKDAVRKGGKFSTKCDIYLTRPIKIRLIFEPFLVSDFNDGHKKLLLQNSRYYIIRGVELSGESELVDVFDKIGTGYYELDEMGNITQANEFFARTLGYSKDELLESYLNINSFIHDNFELTKQKNLLLKEVYLNNTWRGFITLSTKFKDSVHALLIQKAFYSEIGKINRIIGYLIRLPDKTLITKARGIEEGWIDYSWQCFFIESPYPVAVVEKNGIITRFNNALETLTDALLVKEDFQNLFTEEGKFLIAEEMQKIISNPSFQPKPIENIKLKNRNKIVDVYMGKIFDLNGSLYGFMARIADVTQQKELEESLSHAQRMQTIGYLAGSIAHDFNNLLTAILGFCDVLLLKHMAGDPSFAHIMQIRQSANRASNLVNRLLAFSRRQTLKPQVLNLNEFFGDFYSLIQRLVGVDVEVSQEIAPDLLYIKVDPVQFEQVILNLVVNAHQAMSEGGKLLIRAQNISIKENDPYLLNFITPKGEQPASPGDYVAVEVMDNGTGISSEIIDKIFEPFFTTKQEKSGTGLGLSTVYGIVIQSGGHIYLKTQLTKGTTFLILMPKYTPIADEIISEKPTIEMDLKKDYSGKELIILIEDEEAVRTFSKHVLTSKGYDVLDFFSPLSALKEINKLGSSRIDLIITDVVMPEMSGPHLISEIQKTYPELKVIFISGYGEEAFTESYGKERDFHFLPKPFTLKDLLIKVKEVLES